MNSDAGGNDSVVENCIGRLRDGDPATRARAAGQLAVMGPRAHPAIGALIDALADTNPEVRHKAAAALGEIGPEAGAAVSALATALRDEDELVRRRAALALGELGLEAVSAVPQLIRSLRDPSPSVRRWAAATLGEISPQEAAPALVEALGEEDVRTRAVVAAALVKLGEGALPSLLEATRHPAPGVRSQAARLLARCERGREALRELLADPAEEVRETARQGMDS
jgi:HEAT repeat protein